MHAMKQQPPPEAPAIEDKSFEAAPPMTDAAPEQAMGSLLAAQVALMRVVKAIEVHVGSFERLIVERAQLQLARESSLRVDDATLDRAIERIASNNKLSIDQLRAMPIRAVNPMTGEAHSIKLGDVATVRRAYVDPPITKVRFQGNNVVAIGISMAKGGDIIELGKHLQDASAKIRADLPVGVELSQIQDQPQAVNAAIADLLAGLE